MARARRAAQWGEGSKDHVIGRRRRARRAIIVVAVTAVLGGNATASYFVPVYAGSIGKVPGLGNILSLTGLGAADVTVINASDQHDGVRLTVVDGYADENGTILTLNVMRAGSPAGGPEDWMLTDQFGRRYDARQGGFGDKRTASHGASNGATPGFLSFAPISGAAVIAGARMTLQIGDWNAFPASPAAVGAPGTVVHSTWRVTFVLMRHPAVHVAWTAARSAGITYSFPSATVTDSKLVQIHWMARGAAVRQALAAAQAASPPSGLGSGCSTGCARPGVDPTAALRQTWPQLLDSAGHAVAEVPYVEGPFLAQEGDTESGVLQYVLTPGRYRLVVRGADGSGFERDLTVG
ncbi:MAG: DUF4179 domain-containing protein [Candidatus Dormibacteria bacterium]